MSGTTVFNGCEYRVDTTMLRQPKPSTVWMQRAAVLGALGGAYFTDYLGVLGKCLVGGLLSATVVIPAVYLVGGKRLTAYMISFMLPTVMKGIDARFRNVRKELLRGVEGKVLDFGSGSGEYLKYAYRARNSSSSSKPVTELVALEPNLNLHATLTRSIAALEREQEQELGQAKVLSTKIVGCFADEHLKEVGEGYYDWIIL
eukprot:gene29870-24176_t